MNIFNKEERKVEYIELIYDLIFVYMVGRNNTLLHHVEDGFISWENFFVYILCSLAIIQIWGFTTFYINMFGKNNVREYIFLFINMYLMYFIGEATREDWVDYQTQYHIAWGLILINIGVQYVIEYRNHKADVWNQDIIKRMAITLFIEAAIVFVAAIPNQFLGIIASAVAIVAGILLTSIGTRHSAGGVVDFAHLSERAMLYVVFTFGEMIIALATYFVGDGSFDITAIYYSLMTFLVVAGLFLSYGLIYDHLLDRDKDDNGMIYMAIHIFILFALNNITTALEFMRDAEVDVMPKVIFLVLSIVAYYAFLLLLGRYAKKTCGFNRKLILKFLGITVVFVVAMVLLRNVMYINLLMTVAYIFILYFGMRRLKNVSSD